jgi:hypothetical protein
MGCPSGWAEIENRKNSFTTSNKIITSGWIATAVGLTQKIEKKSLTTFKN